MPSPFPGMDPYLEDPRYWTEFEREMIRTLMAIIATVLVDRYKQRIAERTYRVNDSEADHWRSGEQLEQFIEIRNRSGGKLVTLVDVVSPANKRSASGREAYLKTRQESLSQNASTVEIDLLLQGTPTLSYSRDGLPEFDYSVTVTKAGAPDRYEIYTSLMNKRLPKFKIPLAPDDRDMLLDLQAAFARSYDLLGFASRIEYSREPAVPMTEAGLRALAEMRRLLSIQPHENISVAAYYVWLQAGCPHGCDQEHWYQARKMLEEGGR